MHTFIARSNAKGAEATSFQARAGAPGELCFMYFHVQSQVTAAERGSEEKVARMMTEHKRRLDEVHVSQDFAMDHATHHDWRNPRREYRFDSDNDPYEDGTNGGGWIDTWGRGRGRM